MLLSFLIQYRYSKIQILRSYLDLAFFGSHLYGIDNALRFLFNKNRYFDELTPGEAAIIASLLVYPRPLVPNDLWHDKVRKRAEYLLSLYPRFEQRFEKLPRWKSV